MKLKHRFLDYTIQKKLFVSSIILIMTVVVTFYFISYWLLSNLIIEKQAGYDINSFKQADSYLKSYFGNLDRYAQKIASDKKLHSSLTSYFNKTDFADINERISTLNVAVESSFNQKNFIDSILIVGTNNLTYKYSEYSKVYSLGVQGKYLGDDFSYAKYFEKTGLFGNGQEYGIPTYFTKGKDAEQESAVEKEFFSWMNNKLVYMKLLQTEGNTTSGAIIITFDNKLLDYIFSSASANERLYLLGGNKELIWTNQENSEGWVPHVDHPGNRDKLISTYYSLPNYNFQFVSEIPIAIIMNRGGEIRFYTLLYAIFCLILVLLVSYFFSRRLSKPLHELAKSLSGEISFPMESNLENVKVPWINVNLRMKIVMYFMVTVIFPGLLFMMVTTYKDYDIYRDKITQYTINTMKWVKWNIDYSFNTYDDITRQIVFSDPVQDLMYKSLNKTSAQQASLEVEKLFHTIKMNRKDFLSMSLFNLKGDNIYSEGYQDNLTLTNFSNNFFEKIKKSEGSLVLIETQKEFNMNPVLIFSRIVHSNKDSNFGSEVGYLVFTIDKDAIYNLFQKIKPDVSGSNYFLLDSEGKSIVKDNDVFSADFFQSDPYHNVMMKSDSGFYTVTNNKQDNLLFYDTTIKSELKIVGVVPFAEIKSKVFPLLWYGLICMIAFSLMILLVSSLISSSIARPLRKLEGLMNEVKKGNLNIHMNYKGRDEIAILSKQFNKMIQRLNDLIYENYQSKLRESELLNLQKEAEIHALQQQINPHFLYNTLESIKWMAYLNGVTEISDMVTALGKFFRGSISRGRDFVLFSEEIDHLHNYIYIQRIRYQDKFSVQWEIEEDVRSYKTVKLILQPIMENAINHGIDSIENEGVIKIRGYIVADTVHFEIEDNGVGMSQEQLDFIKGQCMSSSMESNQSGIGLSNVYRRLKLRYGENCYFDIFSEKGKGTIIKFSIPATKE
ncbi:MAG: sensor histidine kinase [Bacilli bacterium]|nr:sensor histidine kinase [Bacilli bacterium]